MALYSLNGSSLNRKSSWSFLKMIRERMSEKTNHRLLFLTKLSIFLSSFERMWQTWKWMDESSSLGCVLSAPDQWDSQQNQSDGPESKQKQKNELRVSYSTRKFEVARIFMYLAWTDANEAGVAVFVENFVGCFSLVRNEHHTGQFGLVSHVLQRLIVKALYYAGIVSGSVTSFVQSVQENVLISEQKHLLISTWIFPNNESLRRIQFGPTDKKRNQSPFSWNKNKKLSVSALQRFGEDKQALARNNNNEINLGTYRLLVSFQMSNFRTKTGFLSSG